MNTDFVVQCLRQNHLPQAGWIFLTEVPTRLPQWSTGRPDLDSQRVIDAFAIHTWKTKNYSRVSYEIKVSRADWLSELKDCKKRTQAYFLSNRFYFAVAEGVVTLAKDNLDCLDGCGVLEIRTDASMSVLRPARFREAWPMPDHFVAALLRRACRSARGETSPAQLVLQPA